MADWVEVLLTSARPADCDFMEQDENGSQMGQITKQSENVHGFMNLYMEMNVRILSCDLDPIQSELLSGWEGLKS